MHAGALERGASMKYHSKRAAETSLLVTLPSNQKTVSPRLSTVPPKYVMYVTSSRTFNEPGKLLSARSRGPFAASFAPFSLPGFSLPSRFLAPDNLQTDHRDLPYLLQNGYSSRSSLIFLPSRTNDFPRSRKLINFTFCQLLNFLARVSMKVRSS